MNTYQYIAWKTFVTCLSISTLSAQGIPEPPIIFYGMLSSASPSPDLSTVAFTLTGNSETVTTTTPTQLVTVDSQNYFIVKIPFETRAIQGGTNLTATANTLALPATNTTYTVSAKVGTHVAIIPNNKTSLTYSAQQQGLIERIDLSLSETYEQWSQRQFGSIVSQTEDPDGDNHSNYEEYLAGTNPQDSNSRLSVKTFSLQSNGEFTVTWDTVQGKTYRVERSSSLNPDQWTTLQSNILGDGSVKNYTDQNPTAAPRLFYRIAVSQ